MKNNNIAVDYLRAFITLLVVAHHSFIAYARFAPPPTHAFGEKPYIWMALPVIDTQRWLGFDILILFNDTFFMSLMFLLSGLFVWQSMQRKGATRYMQDRTWRLGLPFVLAVIFLSPLAYYPAYLLRAGDPSFSAYAQQWFTLANWPAGPCWFIAVLLGFDSLAVMLHRLAPSGVDVLGRICSGAALHPVRFFFGLLGASILTYVSMRAAFGPIRWFSFGPFAIQASRVFLYLTYFLAGVGIGVWGNERGLLASDGMLARRWPLWLMIALVAFVLQLGFSDKSRLNGAVAPLSLQLLAGVVFVLSCTATSFFLLAIFARFAKRRGKLLDHFSASAYGIYLVHYAFVTWIQYALIDVNLSAMGKGLVAFVVALLLSWLTIGAARLLKRNTERLIVQPERPG